MLGIPYILTRLKIIMRREGGVNCAVKRGREPPLLLPPSIIVNELMTGGYYYHVTQHNN